MQCRCGHHNHSTGTGRLPAGCLVPECRCEEPEPVVCELFPRHRRGRCDACGQPLDRGRRRWCSDACERRWQTEHVWAFAREAALVRDAWSCVVCRRGPGAERILAALILLATGGMPKPREIGDGLVPADDVAFIQWMGARLEVNHIDPRRGQGYRFGCHHHQGNLETLCRLHHVAVTTAQRRGFVGSALGLIEFAQPALVTS